MILKKESKILFILTLAQFFSLSLWFSANAVKDQYAALYNLTNTDLALYSIITIVGFVVFGFISSILNLADVIRPKNFFTISAIFGGIANIFTSVAPDFNWFLVFRFLTGAAIAGVYPIGMKLVSSHYKENRGLAIGILVSAVISGSGLPYIFNIFGAPSYILVAIFSSSISILGGLLVYKFVTEGPYMSKGSLSITNVNKLIKSKPFIYANVGYFGHMWELYAFWIFGPLILGYSYNLLYDNDQLLFFSLSGFSIFIAGALGSIYGGKLSDTFGRTKFNIIMLSLSGLSSIIFGLFIKQPFLLLLVALVWGLTIVPDSPQYSAMITELVEESLVGTALTIQTAIGFTVSLITIFLVPLIETLYGWGNSLLILVLGPITGIIAMLLLRKHPESIKIANGKK